MAKWNSYRVTEFGRPLELQSQELPEPQGTEVLLSVAGCGVCHSDLHIWDGYFDLGGGRKTPIRSPLPLTLGHEIVGEVIAAGPEAIGVKIGDRRIVYPWIGCGEPNCGECRRGDEHLCGKRALGLYRHGGYSDHVLVPHPRYLVRFGGIAPGFAATCACSGLTAYGALKKVGALGADDRLLLIGAGGVGLAAVRLAKAVTRVAAMVAETDPAKRTAALDCGAVEAIDPSIERPAQDYLNATGGVAAAIDFVGSEESVRFATGVLRKGAKLIIVGLFGGTLQMPIAHFPLRGIALQGSNVGTLAELQDLVNLPHSDIGVIPFTTRPLHEVMQALADLRAGKIVGRVVLTP